MDVTLIDIKPDLAGLKAGADYLVVVTLIVDGQQEQHDLLMRPTAVPELGAGLLVPGASLTHRLQDHQAALSRLCNVVARQVTGSGVHLPQLIAA